MKSLIVLYTKAHLSLGLLCLQRWHVQWTPRPLPRGSSSQPIPPYHHARLATPVPAAATAGPVRNPPTHLLQAAGHPVQHPAGHSLQADSHQLQLWNPFLQLVGHPLLLAAAHLLQQSAHPLHVPTHLLQAATHLLQHVLGPLQLQDSAQNLPTDFGQCWPQKGGSSLGWGVDQSLQVGACSGLQEVGSAQHVRVTARSPGW